MKRQIRGVELYPDGSLENILGMSDVKGSKIKVEKGIDFSFYYSAKNAPHGPRVKVLPNPSKMNVPQSSSLALTGDWILIKGKDSIRIGSDMLKKMKAFFHKYLVMFLAVWDGHTDDEPSLGEYLRGDISLNEFIQNLDFYDAYREDFDKITTVSELEKFCRDNHLVNMFGN